MFLPNITKEPSLNAFVETPHGQLTCLIIGEPKFINEYPELTELPK